MRHLSCFPQWSLALAALFTWLPVEVAYSKEPGAVTLAKKGDSPTRVVLRNRDSKVMEFDVDEMGPDGKMISVPHRYTELATCLHYLDRNGQWVPSDPGFSLEPGAAVAGRLHHKVRLGSTTKEPGYVSIDLPNGQKIVSHVYGLAYHDLASDQAILVAEVKSSSGVLTADNEVTYPDAFSGAFQGSIRYTTRRSGLEQDVIIQGLAKPGEFPGPEKWGMDPLTTRLEVWTEFLGATKPKVSIDDGKPENHAAEAAPLDVIPPDVDEHNFPKHGAGKKPDLNLPFPVSPPTPSDLALRGVKQEVLANHRIDFGFMQMIDGVSFPVGPSFANPRRRVQKQWIEVNGGRSFLAEAIDLEQIRAEFRPQDPIPTRGGAFIPNATQSRQVVLNQLPKRKPSGIRETVNIRVAQPTEIAALNQRPGIVVDYSMQAGTTSLLPLLGNQTYWVTDAVNVSSSGTAWIEPGCVIKFAKYVQGGVLPSLNIYGSFSCLATTYHPVVLTAVDDQTFGETIPGSDPNGPGPYVYAGYALNLANGIHNANWLNNFRVRNAVFGIMFNSDNANWIRNSQFQKCTFPVADLNQGTVVMENCLFDTGVNAYGYNASVFFENWIPSVLVGANVTIHNYSQLRASGYYSFANLNPFYNSILTDLAVAPALSGGNNYLGSSAGIYQTVMGGKFYLAPNSPWRNAGQTANLSATLIADLRRSTTYPPVVLNNSISIPSVIGVTAPRDTDTPDVGYHYPSVDIIPANIEISGGSLTVTNGAVIACPANSGIRMGNNSKLTIEGTPNRMSVVTWLQGVQEDVQPINNSTAAMITVPNVWPIRPQLSFRFVEFPGFGCTNAGSRAFYAPSAAFDTLSFSDCLFEASTVTLDYNLTSGNVLASTVGFTNNVFERANLNIIRDDYSQLTASLWNNDFYGGTVKVQNSATTGPSWVINDNIFYYPVTSISGANIQNNYNAYLGVTLPGTGRGNISTGIGFSYGPLGGWYQSNANYVNLGSRYATNAGLYHYTTQASLVNELGTLVDIGFHYVAISSSGIPTDTDGDGIPDYLEDRNGNGNAMNSPDPGETDWNTYTSANALSLPTAFSVFTPLK